MVRSFSLFAGSSLLLRASLLGATSLIAIGAAQAQETGSEIVLDTVQVQGSKERGDGPVDGYVAQQSTAGTKTDTPIADTPVSISVVPRQQIEDQQAESVAEALRYSPGVFSEYRGASNLRDEIFVRGFYYVPKYLDGLFFGGDLEYSKMYPYLLERVELISGPASVLYGQLNPGGLINMVSKKPTDEPFHQVELTVGTGNMFQGSFDLSDKLVGTDDWRYRIVGTGLTTDLQEDYAEQQGFAIAPSLTWTPDAQTTLTILAGYQYEPEAGFRNFLDAAGTLEPIEGYGYVSRNFFVSDPDWEDFNREQAWIGYEFERELNNVFTVRQKARYLWVDTLHHTLTWGSSSVDDAGEAWVSRNASGGTETWGIFTIDNQVQANFNTGAAEHTVLAGLDYRNRSRDYWWGYNFDIPDISLNNPVYGSNYDYAGIVLDVDSDETLSAWQTGVYLQDQITIGRLHLLAGIRYDWADTTIDDNLAGTSTAYDDQAFTYRLGALYAFDNGIAPYVSYSTSFEPALYTPLAGENPFDPTTAEQFEVGVKYAPTDRILLTAAYYDITQNNVVEGVWNSTLAQTVYSQIGEVHNRGFELSARAEIVDNWNVVASYSYVDSVIEDSKTASQVGNTPARIPQHQAGLWSTYSFNTGKLNGLTIGGGVRYIGESWGNSGNTFTVPSATLYDAMLRYDLAVLSPKLKGVEVQVNAKNLADETYVASCASAYACFYGEGRTVTGTLRYTW
ncbi:TonB-dependent siderophore receptor [Ancylobacter sp. Lp-2]|uniref:TonB-dependent siderophore receptor n=1 Tax=Ancylobacter sp. Lp-2 TaxID=2881339 RepID=UPI001E5CC487|nr:TonB-dependent siderophore receptor [Ancylobacter sp. Lp-2]MCB4769628.1 TonB-dependent siderophore receptor [Ancylobacter sp. Lp-2]